MFVLYGSEEAVLAVNSVTRLGIPPTLYCTGITAFSVVRCIQCQKAIHLWSTTLYFATRSRSFSLLQDHNMGDETITLSLVRNDQEERVWCVSATICVAAQMGGAQIADTGRHVAYE